MEKENNATLVSKYEEMIHVMDQWIKNLQEGKSIVSYFRRTEIKTIALYGTSLISKRIQQELDNTEIKIELVFDRNSINMIKDVETNIDAIIVTSMYYYYEIYFELRKYTDVLIVGADEIIYKL